MLVSYLVSKRACQAKSKFAPILHISDAACCNACMYRHVSNTVAESLACVEQPF
jgi:hypothetical protein